MVIWLKVAVDAFFIYFEHKIEILDVDNGIFELKKTSWNMFEFKKKKKDH